MEHRSGHFRQNQKEAASFRIVGSATQLELCRLLPLTATILSQPATLCQAVRLKFYIFFIRAHFHQKGGEIMCKITNQRPSLPPLPRPARWPAPPPAWPPACRPAGGPAPSPAVPRPGQSHPGSSLPQTSCP